MKKGVNVIITNNQDRVLVLKRSPNDKSSPNLWDLPGGRVGDNETLREAAKREAKEESGLQIKLEGNYFYIYRCRNKDLVLYGFRAKQISNRVALSKEHVEFKWISKDEWENLNYTPSVGATIREFFGRKTKFINTESFEKRFKGKLKEVFLYITSRCNLKCIHCYMGDVKNVNMDKGTFEKLLEKIVNLGATKITFLGGEPTLHPLLANFIKTAKDLGFDCIRLDTNGEFNQNLLEDPNLKKLSDICFSLDGVNAKTHAKIRMIKNYYSVTKNIKKAVLLGYKVRVTMTINSFNLHQIERLIAKLEKMRVSELNIHLTSKNGRAKNNESLLVKEKDWMDYYKKILPRLAKYKIKIKIPKRYIKKTEISNREITCESAKSSRILVASDFKIYSCPLLLDSDRYFAYFKAGKFYYTKGYRENIFGYSDINGPHCPVLMKDNFSEYKRKTLFLFAYLINKPTNKTTA